MTDLNFDDLIPENKRPETAGDVDFDDLIPAQAEAEPSVAADAANQFGHGFNKGLYATINLPTTLANFALAGVDLAAEQFGGDVDYRFQRPLETVAPGADDAILNPPEAETATGEVFGTIGEMAGANALPAGGMLAAAPKIAAATANATSLGGRVANSVARPVANAPATAAAGEALSTVGAGLGVETAEAVAPDSELAEFIGGVAGGVALPAAVAALPTNIARSTVKGVRGMRANAEKQGRNAISKRLREEMTDDVEGAIKETMDIQENVPGYKPSLAEATETPDLIATQQAIENNKSGSELNQAVQRYINNDRAVSAAADAQGPKSDLDLDDVFERAGGRVNSVRDKLTAANDRLAGKETDLAENLQSAGSSRSQGNTIREELIAARGNTKEEMNIVARELGLDDTRARFDFSQAKEQLKASVTPRSELSDKTKIPSNILADIEKAPDQVSIVDLMELRSRISTDIRIAQRTPTQEGKVPYLQALKQELDLVTDDILSTVDDGELLEDLRKFRDMYRSDLIEPFEQGAAGRVLDRDIDGVYRIPDEKVVKEFFDGWNETAAAQFNKTFENSPRAHTAMEDAALDSLYNFSVRNGQIDLNRVKIWSSRNEPVLKSFPGIKNRISSVEKTLDGISKRRAALAEREAQVNRSYLARELARIENPTSNANPQSVVDDAINKHPARMTRLMKTLKSDQAKDAVAGYVWNKALSSGDPAAFIEANKASVQAALGGKFKSAQRLARAIRKNRLVKRPAGQPIEHDPLGVVEEYLGASLNSVTSRILWAKSGIVSGRYVFGDMVSKAFRGLTGRNAYRALEAAINDPEIAITLANAIEVEDMSAKRAKRLFTYMLSSGIVAFGEESDEKPGTPPKNAESR